MEDSKTYRVPEDFNPWITLDAIRGLIDAARRLLFADFGRLLVEPHSHIVEPPQLWAERLPARLRDRGPTVRREADGTDFWYVDGLRTCSVVVACSR